MIERLKAAWLSLTNPVTLRQLAMAELIEAQRKLLNAQAGLEFAQSEVNRQEATISRLRTKLSDGSLIERDSEVTAERATRSRPRAVSAA